MTTATTPPATGAAVSFARRDDVRIVALYGAVFALLLLAGNLAFHFLPVTEQQHRWPDHPVVETLARWDTGWYFHIAEDGYFYDGPGRQAATAFFPAYPAAVRVTAFVVRDTILAGVLVTLGAAIAASLLLFRWTRDKFDRSTAWLTILLLFLYPFAYFLFGAVYSDALFVASAIAAFVLLERDRPLLAGVAGAVATGGRPVGLAVLGGLVAVAIQRRGGLRGVRFKDSGVLVAGFGFVAFLAYLWWRFDAPMAFSNVQTAEGWNRRVGLDMIVKVDFYRRWRDFGVTLVNNVLTLQALLSVIAIALVPAVWKRLGWGYAVYVVAVMGIPLATSSDFLAMGRYLLPAFPVFAVAASLLVDRPVAWRTGVLAVNGCLLVWLTTLFARWYLLS
ncbi:MAG TPA: mannosyltransferase family protein [Acidimicrobiales bacterium]